MPRSSLRPAWIALSLVSACTPPPRPLAVPSPAASVAGAPSVTSSAGRAATPTVAPLPVDGSVSFSVVVRTDAWDLPLVALPNEVVVGASALILRVEGDTVRQDAGDLRGVDLILTRSAAAFTKIHGPRFAEAYLELTPGARRYGETQVYRPAPGGGFRAVRYAHKNAEGYGFRIGPGGSIWGVSRGSTEEFLTHLEGPTLWPKESGGTEPEGDLDAVASDGTRFTFRDESGGPNVVRTLVGGSPAAPQPVPPVPEVVTNVGALRLEAIDKNLAYMHGAVPVLGPTRPAASYGAVWDGASWSAVRPPPGHQLASFCVRPDRTLWAVAEPDRGTAPPPTAKEARDARPSLLLRRSATSGWSVVPLSPEVVPARVVCDDSRDIWLYASAFDDPQAGALLLRSRPVRAPVTVLVQDSPVDGDSMKDIDPSALSVSAFPPQPATQACPTLWAVLARDGGRLAATFDEPDDPKARPAYRAAKEKERAVFGKLVRDALATATLPEGTKLETFGAGKERWIGASVSSYEIGRALVDTTAVRLPNERPKLLCAAPTKRRPYK